MNDLTTDFVNLESTPIALGSLSLTTPPTQTASGVMPNFTSLQPPVSAILSQNTDLASYAPTPDGAAALKARNSGVYSNKQFIAPFSYQQNVEGVYITVDYLGKRINADGSMPYRAIVSLSAIPYTDKIINNPSIGSPDRILKMLTSTLSSAPAQTTVNAKTTPTENSFIQQYGTGTSAVVSSLGGRLAEYTSVLKTPTSQLFSNLVSTGTSLLQGQIQNKIPISTITQQIASLPGFNVVTNALGYIPGGSTVTSALTNPVGTAATVLQSAVANTIQIQGGLPSLSLNSLGKIFDLAANLASSGPPTSLTGLISLEKQIKDIVCNFKLPQINGASLDSIVKFKFPKPDDISRTIQKQYEDIKSNITNPYNSISTQLKNIIPDSKTLYDAVIKEITTCDNNPNNTANSKSGKPPSSTT